MFYVLLFVFACGSSEPKGSVDAESVGAPVPTASPVSVASNPTATEALKIADAADGTEDGIAHKCAGCALGMDGNAEHALNVDGTTLHLCSAMCKEYFSKDVEANLATLMN